MVRIRPSAPITTPLPLRSSPRVRAVGAPSVALTRNATTAPRARRSAANWTSSAGLSRGAAAAGGDGRAGAAACAGRPTSPEPARPSSNATASRPARAAADNADSSTRMGRSLPSAPESPSCAFACGLAMAGGCSHFHSSNTRSEAVHDVVFDRARRRLSNSRAISVIIEGSLFDRPHAGEASLHSCQRAPDSPVTHLSAARRRLAGWPA